MGAHECEQFGPLLNHESSELVFFLVTMIMLREYGRLVRFGFGLQLSIAV